MREHAMTSSPLTASQVPETVAWHTIPAGDVLDSMGVDPERGLSTAEVDERTRRYGPNRFTAAERESRVHAFFRQYADPMQVVLLVAGVGSLYPLKEVGTGLLLL